jgi:hypothetical protein
LQKALQSGFGSDIGGRLQPYQPVDSFFLCVLQDSLHIKKKKKHFDAKSRNTLQQNCDREHGVLQSCKPSLKCTRTNHTFQTISSRHEQILPYLSGNNLSLGGFWHTSLIDAVMMKITSATRGQQTHHE